MTTTPSQGGVYCENDYYTISYCENDSYTISYCENDYYTISYDYYTILHHNRPHPDQEKNDYFFLDVSVTVDQEKGINWQGFE